MTSSQWLGTVIIVAMALGVGLMIRWLARASTADSSGSRNERGAGPYDTVVSKADQNPGHVDS